LREPCRIRILEGLMLLYVNRMRTAETGSFRPAGAGRRR
jgi:hypothetical protein